MFRLSFSETLYIAGILGLIQILVLFLFGQPAFCECGYIKLWEGVVNSIGNSQHITDWYTFSHIIHGVLFYSAIGLVFPRLPLAWRLLLAMGIEIGWEITENTPWVINQYREQALAQGYVGDSILNSFFDTVAMIGGFFIAWRMPVWFSIVLIIAFELFVGYEIHDGLALNVLNFLYPIDAVTAWQTQAL